jgi:hypothetical protein
MEDYEFEDNEEFETEPEVYECMSCGSIQSKSSGMTCSLYAGPVKEYTS